MRGGDAPHKLHNAPSTLECFVIWPIAETPANPERAARRLKSGCRRRTAINRGRVSSRGRCIDYVSSRASKLSIRQVNRTHRSASSSAARAQPRLAVAAVGRIELQAECRASKVSFTLNLIRE